jgi:hypothetical protein
MRNAIRLPVVVLFLIVAGCRQGNVTNLRLQWLDANKQPIATPAVAAAFAATPLTLTVRDVRRDPSAVGYVQDDGWVVRTSDNVATYVAAHVGNYMERAGARMREAPLANVDIEILELNVIEGNTFQASAQLRVIVRRGGGADGWQQIYRGASSRWGRTHNPENYNEAMSNALEEATLHLLDDPAFAQALGAPPPAVSMGQ